MKMNSYTSKIVFLSTFPPTQCGIATYTQDSIKAINQISGDTIECEICEITKNGIDTHKRRLSLNPNKIQDYSDVAREINEDLSIKLVHIQHEFGLFGGEYGNYLLVFLNSIERPVVITFHSVIPNPNKELKAFVSVLTSYCKTVVVMTEASRRILIEHYTIDALLIKCVPHGTHLVAYESPREIKKRFDLQGRSILATFGLLGSGKSIETALRALPEIVKKHPNVLYLVIGKTHPNTIINNKDAYRTYLEEMVSKLNIENHVRFINEFMEIEVLLSYLKATDVYLFTSKDPNQAVSGTFAYAMSCACPIVATAIPHTKEMLTSNAGILIDIGDSSQLAAASIELLSDDKLRESMAITAFEKTRISSWLNVALKHLNIYENSMADKFEFEYAYPSIKLDHIKNMTTNIGILQFCKVSSPDRSSGYTLDDNARALIAACLSL